MPKLHANAARGAGTRSTTLTANVAGALAYALGFLTGILFLRSSLTRTTDSSGFMPCNPSCLVRGWWRPALPGPYCGESYSK
jgi:hypothetical protein